MQGDDVDVGHGCVAVITDDAAGVYGTTKQGDVVEVTGTDRTTTVDHGWGDHDEDVELHDEGLAGWPRSTLRTTCPLTGGVVVEGGGRPGAEPRDPR